MVIGSHCSDAELLTLLDAEPSGATGPRAHARTCDDCSARLEELRTDAHRFGAVARAVVPSAPPVYDDAFLERLASAGASPARRRWVPALAAAALAGLLLAAPPVRAWVVEAVSQLLGWEAAPPPATAVPVASEVAARLPGPTVRVHLQPGEDPAAVVVRRAAGADVRARLGIARAGAEILVRPDGLALLGTAGGTLELWVPPAIEALEILVDGTVLWSGTVPPDLPDAWQVPWPER